jgi:hypothetical protein
MKENGSDNGKKPKKIWTLIDVLREHGGWNCPMAQPGAYNNDYSARAWLSTAPIAGQDKPKTTPEIVV